MKTVLAPFFFGLLFFWVQPLTKKEQLLQLSKKYFPENYTVLKEYNEDQINGLAQGDSLKEFISDVSTIVHEGYHQYLGFHSSYTDADFLFRINDTLTFPVNTFPAFPSREINTIVPPGIRKKIFRYDSYINTKDKYLVTQQFGILGLFEESIAYYHSFRTEISLFNYYKDT